MHHDSLLPVLQEFFKRQATLLDHVGEETRLDEVWEVNLLSVRHQDNAVAALALNRHLDSPCPNEGPDYSSLAGFSGQLGHTSYL
jgi:hypothetical protein